MNLYIAKNKAILLQYFKQFIKLIRFCANWDENTSVCYFVFRKVDHENCILLWLGTCWTQDTFKRIVSNEIKVTEALTNCGMFCHQYHKAFHYMPVDNLYGWAKHTENLRLSETPKTNVKHNLAIRIQFVIYEALTLHSE
jgi:hypothetical protein